MCLLLASKQDELDDSIPLIRDFQKLSRYNFTYNDCLEEEGTILELLNWNLIIVSPIHVT